MNPISGRKMSTTKQLTRYTIISCTAHCITNVKTLNPNPSCVFINF